MDTGLPDRRQPVHGVKITSDRPTIIFLTVCTKFRSPWLADPAVVALLRQVWIHADAWLVGRYVVMPDHIHLFAGLAATDVDLDRWVTYWKSQFSKTWKRPDCRWQSDHWDTRMRNAEQYEEKWHYIRLNPVRRGLVARPEDWPFQGEVNLLEW